MLLTTGTRLGPYEILAPIGAGGMGEVYKARDTRLDRIVAIKVSQEKFSGRFEQEARAVAALNHPNICMLHDVGPNYLVMEYLEGDTLAARIARKTKGPLPLDQALSIGIQIAYALDAAHRKGVVHRDLKPSNVMLTGSGAKLLDFGLARMQYDRPSRDEDVTQRMTNPGTILGTFQYMAPEQLEAKDADARSDIFAFGAVLYEMLTGRKAFEGKSQAGLISAIMSSEPPSIVSLRAMTPASLNRAVGKCLAKEPDKRWQSANDLADELRWVAEGGSQAQVPPRVPRQSILAWALACLVMMLLIALALRIVAFPDAREETRVLRVSVLLPEKATLPIAQSPPAVSPDGRHLAVTINVTGQDGLWVRDLESLAGRMLPGTEGATYPFWSPDSRFLAFFAGGKLKKIDVTGGPPITLCDAHIGVGGSWSKNDVIVFAPALNSGLFRIPAAGGTAMSVTALEQGAGTISHWAPWFLPDGRHFLYTARNVDGRKSGVYVADLNSESRREILAADSNVVYTPPGYILFLRDRTLMAQPFEARAAKATGDPVPVAEQVDSNPINSLGLFSAAQNGVLVYAPSAPAGDVQLTWFDRTGKVTGTLGTPGIMNWPQISPDGARVAVDREDPQTGISDIWLHDLVGSAASRRFTFGPQSNNFPVWSPDGSHIAFTSTRDGVFDTYQKATTVGTQDEVLDHDTRSRMLSDWSQDGRFIIEVTFNDPQTGFDIWVLPLFGDRKSFPYLQTNFNEGFAKLSPNGQWLAYSSDERQRYEIYVQTFPHPGFKRQVSMNGGRLPIWSRDGKELFYIGADRKLMAVDVKDGSKFESGVPKALFETHLGGPLPWFDVSTDGRFLLPTRIDRTGTGSLTVLVSWTAALKK